MVGRKPPRFQLLAIALCLALLLPSGSGMRAAPLAERKRSVSSNVDYGWLTGLDIAEGRVAKNEARRAGRLADHSSKSSKWDAVQKADDKEEEALELPPADQILGDYHVDGSTSYVLSGY